MYEYTFITELALEKRELEKRVADLEFVLKEILAFKDCSYFDEDYYNGYIAALESVHTFIENNIDFTNSIAD